MAERPTVWDLIDFSVTHVDWPVEVVPDASAERALATELCWRIPRSWWTTYGNLADAFNWIVEREGLGYALTFPRHFGIHLVDDHRAMDAGLQRYWSVPWNRMRDQNARCRSPHRPGQVVRDNGDWGNTRWVEEGGRMYSNTGQAVFTQQFDIFAAVKRGLIVVEFV